MKFLFDFLPIVLFFGVFKYAENHAEWASSFIATHLGFMVSGGLVSTQEAPIFLATLAVIGATLAQVIYLKLRRQAVDKMLWVSLILVVVLGGATLWLHSEWFIKWKPTLLYWIMALSLVFAQFFLKKNLIKKLLESQLTVPDQVWQKLLWAWFGFFATMGALNLWIAHHFSTSIWVNFKLFGFLGLMLAFIIGQGIYLNGQSQKSLD